MKIKIADLIIQINDNNEKLSLFFEDYISDGKTDIEINISQDDIDYEKKLYTLSNLSDFEYYLLSIHRKIAESLPEFDAFLFHGSAIYYNKTATILSGSSGAGKSTHAELLEKHKEIKIINDDKPIVRFINDIPFVYGTPWDGKHHKNENICKPLSNIVFINKNKKNEIVKINKENAFIKALEQTYRPVSNEQKIIKTINILNKVIKSTNQYDLYCDISTKAADTSFEIIK